MTKKLEIMPDTYIFTIVTMGGFGHGSIAAMNRALEEKGLGLNYGRGIRMPANYVIMYNPANPAKYGKTIERANKSIRVFAKDIIAGVQKIKAFPIIANNLYKDIGKLDEGFSVGDGCTACALCEKICSVRNIQMENGKPKWQHRCEHCVAYISWCPSRAITYGGKTGSRRRYHNPHIKANELLRS